MIPRKEDFENEIVKIQNEARQKGLREIQINALELHKKVGFDPLNHRMASACNAIYNLMTRRDEIIHSPPKGKGSSLTVLFHI